MTLTSSNRHRRSQGRLRSGAFGWAARRAAGVGAGAALLCLLAPAGAAPVPAGATGGATRGTVGVKLQAPEYPEAPDGHRGFGATTALSDVLKILRARSEEDRVFVGRLDAMVAELEQRIQELTEHDRARGAFRILRTGVEDPAGEDGGGKGPKVGKGAQAPPEPGLAELHAAFREAAEHPLSMLARKDEASRAFAELYLDTRFRARLEVLAEYEDQLSEFRRGMAVLRGAGDGWIDLSPTQLQNVLARVDLAASFLRAIQKDLNVLRPRAEESSDPAAADALMSAAHARDEALRRRTFGTMAEFEQERLDLMVGTLFTERFSDDPQARVQVDWRDRMRDHVAPLREEALRYMPGTPESEDAGPEIEAMRRHDRLRWALRRSTEALEFDPLDEELAYVAAHCSDFLTGDIVSRALYDRFLALRGIRAHDDDTIRGRELDAREQEALAVVQRPFLPGQRPERKSGERTQD